MSRNKAIKIIERNEMHTRDSKGLRDEKCTDTQSNVRGSAHRACVSPKTLDIHTWLWGSAHWITVFPQI